MTSARPSNPRYVATLTAVATLILVAGWLLRPRQVVETPAPLPSENELAQLARRANRRAIEDMTGFFAGVARDVAPDVLAVPATAVSALRWETDTALAPPLAEATASDPGSADAGGQRSLRRIVSGPSLPFSLLEWPVDEGRSAGERTAAAVAAPAPGSGDWVIAVWQTARGPAWGPGHFLEIRAVRCGDLQLHEIVTSPAPRDEMRGGGLFDLDGNLLGPILPCDTHLAAITADSVRTALDRERQPGWRAQHALGVTLTPMNEQEALHFRQHEGLLVRDVWIDGPADHFGLRPGDVVTTVDEQPVTTPADLLPLTAPSPAAHTLSVQRAGRTIRVAFADEAARAHATVSTPAAGATLAAPAITVSVDEVAPGSRAEAAGVHAGDRLARIDFADLRSIDHANRLLRRPAPMWLEVIRERRRVGLLLP